MINLNKGENEIFLTLKEDSLLENPEYIIEIKSEFKRYFVKNEDLSQFKYRYNLFSITIDENIDLLNGIIDIPTGLYDFIVYEKENITIDDLNEDGVVGLDIVEIGKVRVINEGSPFNIKTKDNNIKIKYK